MENFHTFVDYVLITKRWEYGIAFAFMFAFIFFFTYLQAPKAVPQKAAGLVRRAIDLIQGFLVPENLYFHQGHAWRASIPTPAQPSAWTTSPRSWSAG